MSMLAERKVKSSYTLFDRDRQPFWSKHQDNVGQKLMEKMGWCKGNGLGKDLQGDPEHIRMHLKNDNKGIGFVGNSDKWGEHYDAFESALSNLQETNDSSFTNKSNKEKKAEESIVSLEAKSKMSRARVHYHKFTRGKDTSRFTEDDMACILGSKSSKRKKQNDAAKQHHENTLKETADQELIGHVEVNNGVTTIKGGNINEYFKQKMAALKNRNIEKSEESASAYTIDKCSSELEESVNTSVDIANSKRKSKRKQKELDCQNEIEYSNNNDENDSNNSQYEKKSKHCHLETKAESEQSYIVDENILASSAKDVPSKKKQKKRKTKGLNSINDDYNNTTKPSVNKDNKICENIEVDNPCNTSEHLDENEGNSSIKHKKKKKRKRVCSDRDSSSKERSKPELIDIDTDTSELEIIKEFKTTKDDDDSDNEILVTYTSTTSRKKKSKHKKSRRETEQEEDDKLELKSPKKKKMKIKEVLNAEEEILENDNIYLHSSQKKKKKKKKSNSF